MPYISMINGTTYRVEPGDDEQQRTVTLNDVDHTIDWRRLAPLATADGAGEGGVFSILIAGTSYEVFARRLDPPEGETGYLYEVTIAGARFEVRVEDERARALAATLPSTHATGEAVVRAPMPGLVIGVPLEAGAQVTRGQTVVILEAMKMENDLGAPLNGTIKEVRVKQGQTVNQGEALVVVTGE